MQKNNLFFMTGVQNMITLSDSTDSTTKPVHNHFESLGGN